MQVDERPTPESIAAARDAAARERLEFVVAIGAHNPTQALDSILVRYPDAVAILNEFICLCELHEYPAMVAAFTRASLRRGR